MFLVTIRGLWFETITRFEVILVYYILDNLTVKMDSFIGKNEVTRRKYGRTYKRNTIKICYAEKGVLYHTQSYYRNRSVRWSANAEVKKVSCK